MFYVKGIDITNDKQMFNFLKNHFEYDTMNSWNNLRSIANNVKLYRLDLSGNWCTAMSLLNNGEYENLTWIIQDWLEDHRGYDVFFNGRSNGYLVLANRHRRQVLPDSILYSDDYDEYKMYCREAYGSVRANRDELVQLTKLVQDFDKLCDELRDYCDQLSHLKFEFVEMDKAVAEFNEEYADDLELLGFSPISCDSEGKVDVSEITTLQCLWEAFLRTASRPHSHYKVVCSADGIASYVER